jgi:hypothetical protein
MSRCDRPRPLGFECLQVVAAGTLRCALCGHPFPREATTPAHPCVPPEIRGELVEATPLELPADAALLCLEYVDRGPDER